MLVRICQLQMVHIVLNEILPIFLELFEDDNQKGRGADKELQRMLQNGRGHHTAQPSSGAAAANLDRVLGVLSFSSIWSWRQQCGRQSSHSGSASH